MAAETFFSIPAFEVRNRTSGELHTTCRSLTDLLKVPGVTLMCEELLPGHRASSAHSHSTRTETHVVLKGEVLAHLGDVMRSLGEGDCVCFEGGDDRAHYLENRSTEPALILTVSSGDHGDQVRYAAGPDPV